MHFVYFMVEEDSSKQNLPWQFTFVPVSFELKGSCQGVPQNSPSPNQSDKKGRNEMDQGFYAERIILVLVGDTLVDKLTLSGRICMASAILGSQQAACVYIS